MILLYASTIFLSALLLFQVQPILGKMVLPWFGGTAAVWSSCMLFFQLMLLLGYLYAHWAVRRLPPRRHGQLHLLLLVLSIGLLPIMPGENWKPSAGSDPELGILLLLTATVGLPYFLLSSTGPLLQAWFARERPGSVPYRLFALSNFGSLLGLLSYPLLFEPVLTTQQMSLTWSGGYLAFVLVSGLLTLRGMRALPMPQIPSQLRPTRGERLLWLGLAALPACMLLAVTSHLTANIAPIPLLWVVPLALYLLSFMLCFERAAWYRRRWFMPLLLVLAPAMIVFASRPSLLPSAIGWPIALFCLGLFVVCMTCHGELARLKPPVTQLTSFYLMLALGGALGGLFVAVIAPRIFNDDYELILAGIGTLALVGYALYRRPGAAGTMLADAPRWHKGSVVSLSILGIAWLASVCWPDPAEMKARNFYGTVKVYTEANGAETVRMLAHGMVVHGYQYQSAARRHWPTSYFGAASGAGTSIAANRSADSQRVGIVGLGAGTIAAYCRPGDYYRFYEINPLVSTLANTEFSFLADCQARKDIIGGDARLSLASEAPQHFDVLILDAFSGDAIPVHLLTREAFGIYLRHLKPDGILAVHISNRHLDLAPVVKSAADYYRRDAYFIDARSDRAHGLRRSQWVLLRSGPRIASATPLQVAAPARPWTDDYSSIVGILK